MRARRGFVNKTLATKLGLMPPDTPFNRRAAAYAKDAARLASAKKHKDKKKGAT